MKLKEGAPVRSAHHVGAGDYIKVSGRWKKIESNTAAGSEYTPKTWTVTTEDGIPHSMFGIDRYARAEDLE